MTYKEKLSYCAALLDSEGSLYLTKSYSKSKSKNSIFRAGIKIGMNDRMAIDLFIDVFGGKWYVGSKRICKLTQKEFSPAYVVQYNAEDKIKEIILSVLPYLQVKKEQAELLLEFLRYKNWKRNGQITPFLAAGKLNNLYIKCKKLKSKNWIIKN